MFVSESSLLLTRLDMWVTYVDIEVTVVYVDVVRCLLEEEMRHAIGTDVTLNKAESGARSSSLHHLGRGVLRSGTLGKSIDGRVRFNLGSACIRDGHFHAERVEIDCSSTEPACVVVWVAMDALDGGERRQGGEKKRPHIDEQTGRNDSK
jgi:hypothetical protein